MDAIEFLKSHGMAAGAIDPLAESEGFLRAMEAGLRGEGGLPMVPTYLNAQGELPQNIPTAVIDAGGTNFRRAIVRFEGGGYKVSKLMKTTMPGVKEPCSWEDFVRFTADNIEPVLAQAERVGFCFSYMADITPDRDGYDPRFTKQVSIAGSRGKHICASVKDELSRRGIEGKKFVLLNDTAAVLLGVSATLNKEDFGGFIGLVSGTGTNTCCLLPQRGVLKLHSQSDRKILINLESGYYMDLPRGDFDRELDDESNDPGHCHHEKMTSGAYVGELIRLCARGAAKEGLISDRILRAGRMDTAAADAWCAGEGLEELTGNRSDKDFISALALEIFDRAARCVAANILGILRLTGEGGEKPVCVCAEGSLYLRSRFFAPLLHKYTAEGAQKLGRGVVFKTSEDTTLQGSAAAALLN